MLKKHPYCALCGSNRSVRTIHHIYRCETEEEYENLSENRFIVLCAQCHSFLHWVGRKKNETSAIKKIKDIARQIGFGTDWIKY